MLRSTRPRAGAAAAPPSRIPGLAGGQDPGSRTYCAPAPVSRHPPPSRDRPPGAVPPATASAAGAASYGNSGLGPSPAHRLTQAPCTAAWGAPRLPCRRARRGLRHHRRGPASCRVESMLASSSTPCGALATDPAEPLSLARPPSSRPRRMRQFEHRRSPVRGGARCAGQALFDSIGSSRNPARRRFSRRRGELDVSTSARWNGPISLSLTPAGYPDQWSTTSAASTPPRRPPLPPRTLSRNGSQRRGGRGLRSLPSPRRRAADLHSGTTAAPRERPTSASRSGCGERRRARHGRRSSSRGPDFSYRELDRRATTSPPLSAGSPRVLVGSASTG